VYKFGILINESEIDHLGWVNACKHHDVRYVTINLTRNNWLDEIRKNKSISYFLARPPGITAAYKLLYDERLFIISRVLNLPIFPSLEACLIYENKRFLSYWLKANKIPHPQTSVFYNMKEAFSHLKRANFPIVAKVNIGASGSGVTILNSLEEANSYIKETFTGKGARKRSGPNFEKGRLLQRGMHYIIHPKDIAKKINTYKPAHNEKQTELVIFQEYIPHTFEWRVVRIGNSFFAHKKLKHNDKTSGTLLKGYENPPLDLLNFVKDITDKYNFYSQAIDIFETNNGYLVNEMQSFFGQSDPYQMLVDEKPGRYLFMENRWIFEEGNYTSNQCYDLRLDFVLQNRK